jgi:deoxyribodipyrimidine photo-lyase
MPDEAFDIAVRLNDRFELDGRIRTATRSGVAIGGKHDRPWAPGRPVFGMIRYMNAKACARKFDVAGYIARVDALDGKAPRAPSQAELF